MTAFADACRRPFANGTEGNAWERAWCETCIRDHNIHADNGQPGCDLFMQALVDEWPEGWVPEPDDGQFYLPSRLVCLAYSPCTEGECEGDPAPAVRAFNIAETTAYWQSRNAT